MPRPATHDESSLLDSARAVVLERGVRGATIAAVAGASGAPTGSIYHRFGSVDELLARAWVRAARRSHAAVHAQRSGDPAADVVASALATYDFCLSEREDALLLTCFRRADFETAGLDPDLRRELEEVNAPIGEPIRELARRAFGRADRAAVDLLLVATVHLPYGFARRYLEAGMTPPASHRERLAAAVRAAIA